MPAPPPPPPPVMNGSIPTIRLKSEVSYRYYLRGEFFCRIALISSFELQISDRCEPPAKLQNAMMKDKKPFTYTPGGIDLSEIKSPRMQRRIVRNAQTPDDVILPTTTAVNTNSLPPSAVAAMTPQMAIPVFPQNGFPKKSSANAHPKQTPPPKQSSPPPPPQKQQIQRTIVVNSQPQQVPPKQSSPPPQKQQIPRTIVLNMQPQQDFQHQQNSQERSKEQPRAQVGSIYIPPVTEPVQSKPAFPTLREAPTPWLQKHQQPQEDSKPAWVRNKNNVEGEQKEVIYERKPRAQQVQVSLSKSLSFQVIPKY